MSGSIADNQLLLPPAALKAVFKWQFCWNLTFLGANQYLGPDE
jgi:hypothetical protein